MLVVKQGQVAVIKAYVGLATKDTSGADSSMARWFARTSWHVAGTATTPANIR